MPIHFSKLAELGKGGFEIKEKSSLSHVEKVQSVYRIRMCVHFVMFCKNPHYVNGKQRLSKSVSSFQFDVHAQFS